MPLPLTGLTVTVGASGSPYRTAAWLLSGLGATVGEDGGPGSRLRPGPDPNAGAGLPPGVVDYATGVALAAGALAGWRTGRCIEVSELAVAMEIWLPEVMAAAYSSPSAMRPGPPVPAPGPGWLNLDLGAPGDAEDYSRLLETLPADASAESVAEAAQEWRLPVCDYRPRSSPAPQPPIRFDLAQPSPRPAAPELKICDLTTMWAGPLATRLLQALGAEVHKVEPSFRPDGMRAVTGGGIHPGGRQVDPGRDSAMWNALNHGKSGADLDLREPEQMERFLELCGSCDVVIDSFSPRVMPNFGLGGALFGGPLSVSMPAFGPGPQREWVAYGTGVHARLGLGEQPDGSFFQPAVSYPDPVAGFTGALAVLVGVTGRDLGNPVARLEATLAGAAQPLLACARSGPMGPPDPDTGGRLLDLGRAEGLMIPRRVAGLDLLHPAGPFRMT